MATNVDLAALSLGLSKISSVIFFWHNRLHWGIIIDTRWHNVEMDTRKCGGIEKRASKADVAFSNLIETTLLQGILLYLCSEPQLYLESS